MLIWFLYFLLILVIPCTWVFARGKDMASGIISFVGILFCIIMGLAIVIYSYGLPV